MIFKKLSFISLVSLVFSFPVLAEAQSNTELERELIERVRSHYPEFRLVKKIEDFPERYNTSVKLPIRGASGTGSATERALVTLHDGNTGEPLESCFTPCNLHKAPGRPVFVFPYKFGHFTYPNEIEADPDQMRLIYPYWSNEYQVKLGPDYRKVFLKRKICQREFENMERIDRDAKPCYRIPPPMPDVNYSGKCKMIFDVSPKGFVKNAKIRECSNPIFEDPSFFALSQWTYFPKVEQGMPVTRTGVKTTLTFAVTDFDDTLLDENGERIED